MDDREIWYLPSKLDAGTVIFNAHSRASCYGHCPLHNPSDHWARELEMVWCRPSGRMRTNWMGRRCEHGVIHDDPDDAAFRLSRTDYRPPRSAPCVCRCCYLDSASGCDWLDDYPPF